MKIIIGFNSKMGRENAFRSIIERESLHKESNDNEVRIINFTIAKNLIVKSTYFKHRDIRKQT